MNKVQNILESYEKLNPKFKKQVQLAVANEFEMSVSSVRTNWFSRGEITLDNQEDLDFIIDVIQKASVEQELQKNKVQLTG